jgi:hypothetical protein
VTTELTRGTDDLGTKESYLLEIARSMDLSSIFKQIAKA